jgi:transposase
MPSVDGVNLAKAHLSYRTSPSPAHSNMSKVEFKRRSNFERTFAWLGNFRRLVVRWECNIMMTMHSFTWR